MSLMRQTVGALCKVDSGPAFKSPYFVDPSDGVPLLRGENIEPGRLRWVKTRAWPRELLEGHEHLYVEPGDLILGMDRPVISTGLKLARVTEADCPSLLVQRVARIHPLHVDGTYLYHWLSGQGFIRHLQGTASGTQLPHVTLKSIRDYPVPRFGPYVERRIVEILEEHLSHLDAAAADLTRANVRLESLSEAALQVLIPGDAVRRPLSEVLEVPLSNGRSVPSRDGGFPVLRLTALKEDGVDLEERKGGAWERAEAVRFLVKEGDFLIARGNGSLRLVGKGSLLRHEPDEVAFPDTAIRARARPSAVLPEFLSLVWNSRSTRDQIERVARTSAGIYKVNQSQLGAIQLPVPELSEQMSIVAAMSRLQEHRHVALETIDIATRRSHSLRRAVLEAAFEGKLTGRHTDVEVVEELAGA
ncbi:MAG: hypothetical protein LWW86_05470 [Micrococcales bacterium]|nr:hypothetical protein [Micrococcales bacterium]